MKKFLEPSHIPVRNGWQFLACAVHFHAQFFRMPGFQNAWFLACTASKIAYCLCKIEKIDFNNFDHVDR